MMENHRELLEPWFDADYYLSVNRDVRDEGIDPLEHYCAYGWRERRNPSRSFDVEYYLANNPDVISADVDPLLHYVLRGREEGRDPVPTAWAERQELHRYRQQVLFDSPRLKSIEVDLSAGELEAAISEKSSVGIILSLSHDDYATAVGGIQNLIGDEREEYNQRGWQYLYLSPAAAPLQTLEQSENPLLSIRLNGRHLGIIAAEALVPVIARAGTRQPIQTIVHHMMGQSPAVVGRLCQLSMESSGNKPVFWVHDFFTVCSQYNLLRNGISFCGAPDPYSAACEVCCHGLERKSHSAAINELFEATRPIVLAPSKVALEHWTRYSALPHSEAQVRPLAKLVFADQAVREDATTSAALRIAHLGGRVFHKGWHVFERLANRFRNDHRYDFVCLGGGEEFHQDGILNYPVIVSPERRHAMVEAVALHNIDAVVNVSIWPETFSYTAYEALAGGAFLIAGKSAGNVWPVVQENAPGQGCALDSEADLIELFESGTVVGLVRGAKRRRGALIADTGTAGWMLSNGLLAS